MNEWMDGYHKNFFIKKTLKCQQIDLHLLRDNGMNICTYIQWLSEIYQTHASHAFNYNIHMFEHYCFFFLPFWMTVIYYIISSARVFVWTYSNECRYTYTVHAHIEKQRIKIIGDKACGILFISVFFGLWQ